MVLLCQGDEDAIPVAARRGSFVLTNAVAIEIVELVEGGVEGRAGLHQLARLLPALAPIGGELVVAGGDPAEVFDLAEEALDEVARLVEMGAEADRVLAV